MAPISSFNAGDTLTGDLPSTVDLGHSCDGVVYSGTLQGWNGRTGRVVADSGLADAALPSQRTGEYPAARAHIADFTFTRTGWRACDPGMPGLVLAQSPENGKGSNFRNAAPVREPRYLGKKLTSLTSERSICAKASDCATVVPGRSSKKTEYGFEAAWPSCNKLDPVTEKSTRYPVPFVSQISQDTAGMLWLATPTGGLYSLDPAKGSIRQYSHDSNDPSTLSSDDVIYTGEDREGTQGLRTTDSGVMPDPGLTYSNTFLDYSFDQLKCPGCGLASKLNVGVYIDLNVFMYVTKIKILGGNFAILAGLPLSNNAISLPGLGPISAGNGFSDSFYQPFTLGWHLKRAEITTAYALFAPTGRFTPGGTNNTGSGYWTNAPTAGETVYLTKNKATAISAYELYEFHTTQEGTNIHPGQTFNLDYSLSQVLPLTKDKHTLLQVALAGYGMWQTSDNSGPGINPTLPGRYRANALGGVVNILLPEKKASLGVSVLKEFADSNTVQGYSLQITGGIQF